MKNKRIWKIVSWNINSIRRRQELVAAFLETSRPDFLCLQEIKCTEEQFPAVFFSERGYRHQLLHGQKAYHGVAILSRHSFIKESKQIFGARVKADHHARHIHGCFETASGKIDLHNFYVPAGGDIPDPKENKKFAHKLRFIKDMEKFFSRTKNKSTILVGDLNIAPHENDVWSHKQLLNVVSHTPVEVKALIRLIARGAWIDIARQFFDDEEKLYSWWSYRARNWRTSDRGRRLDHIWTSPDLAPAVKTFHFEKELRGADSASDHVPVVMTIRL